MGQLALECNPPAPVALFWKRSILVPRRKWPYSRFQTNIQRVLLMRGVTHWEDRMTVYFHSTDLDHR